MSHFKKTFEEEIVPQLQKELKIKNRLGVPRLKKIVVNSGVGRFAKDKKILEDIAKSISLITGQKPVITKARKAISGFKIRQGMPVGIKVTLRGKRMYDFVEKLVKLVLPRIRDFEGIDIKSLDEAGNLTIAFREVSSFPEISHQQKVEHDFGLEITLVTDAKDKSKALELFKKIGLIFKENQ